MDFGLVGLGLKQAGIELPNLGANSLVGGIAGTLGAAKDQTVNQFGELRKAGQILKSNPAGALLTDLIFPEPFQHGTLDAAMKRGDFNPNQY